MKLMSDQSRPINPAQELVSGVSWAKPFMPVRRLVRFYNRAQQENVNAPTVFDSFLRALDVNFEVSERDLEQIPATGPTILFCNHPFGILDGLVIGALAMRVRKDVKIITTRMLAVIPELAPHSIWVDNFGSGQAFNTKGVRESLRFLRSGGLVIVFPAGEVSHWRTREWRITDPEWNVNGAGLARLTKARCVPMHIGGHNGVPFQLAGIVHKRLRTFRLPHELLNKRGHTVQVRVGAPVEPAKIEALGDDVEITRYMRWNTHLLSLRQSSGRRLTAKFHLPKPTKRPTAVPDASPAEQLAVELQNCGEDALLEQQGPFQVFAVTGQEAPLVLREIGRLRELTFRAVGEGTGNALDLDQFDHHYTHVVLWNREKSEIVGAYRMGRVRSIVQRYGVRGLYTSTLFKFSKNFFNEVDSAVELGRSFVRTEYQKQYAPLLLLWKGIGTYIVRHPETPIMFGAVSISNDYSPASRELITGFLRSHMADPALVRMVVPKNPPRQSRESKQSMVQQEIFARAFSLDDISKQVSQFEADGKNVPILLKHYLKLGGTMLAFNIDPKFSDVLDGLLMVDLRVANPGLLEKYFGKAGSKSFLAYHGRSAEKAERGREAALVT
jgi:putative hemolysin